MKIYIRKDKRSLNNSFISSRKLNKMFTVKPERKDGALELKLQRSHEKCGLNSRRSMPLHRALTTVLQAVKSRIRVTEKANQWRRGQARKAPPKQGKKIEMTIIRVEIRDVEGILSTESVCGKVGIIPWCSQRRAWSKLNKGKDRVENLSEIKMKKNGQIMILMKLLNFRMKNRLQINQPKKMSWSHSLGVFKL